MLSLHGNGSIFKYLADSKNLIICGFLIMGLLKAKNYKFSHAEYLFKDDFRCPKKIFLRHADFKIAYFAAYGANRGGRAGII